MKHRLLYFFTLMTLAAVSSGFAQTEMTVNCYPTVTPFNSYSLNGNVAEYGPTGSEPSFCVVIVDPQTCLPWQTAYNGEYTSNDFGNINQNGNGKMRSEYFFQFQQTDSLQLAGMNGLLSQIPTGYSVTVFTAAGYNYQQINQLSPALIQSLESRWDAGVIQSAYLMVLHGFEDDAASFVEDTVLQSDHISFTAIVCEGAASIDDDPIQPVIVAGADGAFYLTGLSALSGVELVSYSGTTLPVLVEDEGEAIRVQPEARLSAGIYLLSGTTSGVRWVSRVIVP